MSSWRSGAGFTVTIAIHQSIRTAAIAARVATARLCGECGSCCAELRWIILRDLRDDLRTLQ